jgi:hypothetical protein
MSALQSLRRTVASAWAPAEPRGVRQPWQPSVGQVPEGLLLRLLWLLLLRLLLPSRTAVGKLRACCSSSGQNIIMQYSVKCSYCQARPNIEQEC